MVRKILVSQPQPTSEKSPYYDTEKGYDVECVFRPLFKVEGLSAKEFRRQRINILDYSAIVFTSRHAIDHFFTLAKEIRITIPKDMKCFCALETIALYIQKYIQYRKRKVFLGMSGRIADLVPLMVKHKTEKYLVPMSSVHNDDLKNLLNAKKLRHTECVMYRTMSNDMTEGEVKTFDYDMIIFLGPTDVKALQKDVPHFEQGDIKIGAFEPATCKAVEVEGFRPDLKASDADNPSITGALKTYLKKSKK